MKLSKKQRAAIVEALRSNVQAHTAFTARFVGGVSYETYASRILSLASRVEMSTETEKDGYALRYLPCLPYTLPDVFDGGPGAMGRLGVLLSAYYVVNGYSHHFRRENADDAAALMMVDLS